MEQSKYGILIVLVLLAGNVFAGADGLAKQQSIDYVLGLNVACTLTDGYRCQSRDESQLLMDPQSGVPAEYLQAWPVAYADFEQLEMLTAEQKKLRHYTVGFAERDGHYIVMLNALLLPELDMAGQPGGRLLRSTLGRSMRYEIDRQSLTIISRKFYR